MNTTEVDDLLSTLARCCLGLKRVTVQSSYTQSQVAQAIIYTRVGIGAVTSIAEEHGLDMADFYATPEVRMRLRYSRKDDIAGRELAAALGWLMLNLYNDSAISCQDIDSIIQPLLYLDSRFQMLRAGRETPTSAIRH